ncbi:hypothetical protein F2Q69_00016771 [Brassica cretica]|uniref:F-box domain-containing protein n=1 Tax=Brassica cretica TaxID=69181 RepID=A0A8S9QPU4_BRACR|nr:hypothetical protein F2Q69_00016771 [Brassica cretica]
MRNNPIAPPPAKKRKTSLSSIPDDVIVNVLARISKTHYRSLCLVSKNFYSLLSSPDIYFARSLIGITDARLYVCLRLPTPSSSSHRHRWFNLGYRQGQLSLVPVRALSSSYSPDRLNSTTVAVHSEIYQIGGGSNEDKRTRAVRVLDCRSRTWRPAPDMKVARKHARSYFLDDKIYVIGGCKENWGEVFDLKTQNWKPLPKPPSDHDHKGNASVFGVRWLAWRSVRLHWELVPGYPDNILLTPTGDFWIGIHSKKSPVGRLIVGNRWLGKLVEKTVKLELLIAVMNGFKPHGIAVKISGETGEILEILEDKEGKTMKYVKMERYGLGLFFGQPFG